MSLEYYFLGHDVYTCSYISKHLLFSFFLFFLLLLMANRVVCIVFSGVSIFNEGAKTLKRVRPEGVSE